jgi:hypothetical protein
MILAYPLTHATQHKFIFPQKTSSPSPSAPSACPERILSPAGHVFAQGEGKGEPPVVPMNFYDLPTELLIRVFCLLDGTEIVRLSRISLI